VTAYVVAARRPSTPWSRSYAVFIRIGLVAVLVRVLVFALLGGTPGTHVLVRLPQLPLPHWLAGLRLGGPVTAEGTLGALYDGMRLAVILICVGAANALTSPRRLLKSLPAPLQEAGVAVTVALSFAPQLVVALERLRRARRLRGRSDRGWRSVRESAVPVLEGALDRSVDLAAAMESRGFGRRGESSVARRRLTAGLTLGGLVAMLASSYALAGAPAPALLGLPLLVAGALLAAAGLAAGARTGRSRYRPDRWTARDLLILGCGAAATAGVWLAPAAARLTATAPPAAPLVPVLALAAVLVAVLPAWLAPR
jgi:energy-coupling factor transport system permease protein